MAKSFVYVGSDNISGSTVDPDIPDP